MKHIYKRNKIAAHKKSIEMEFVFYKNIQDFGKVVESMFKRRSWLQERGSGFLVKILYTNLVVGFAKFGLLRFDVQHLNVASLQGL